MFSSEHIPAPMLRKEMSPQALWTRRFLISLTILTWIIIGGLAIWGIGKIAEPLTLLGISILLAYSIYPLVQIFNRMVPRPLAIFIVYVGIMGIMVLILYFVIFTAFVQFAALLQNIKENVPAIQKTIQPLMHRANQYGLETQNLQLSSGQIINQLVSLATNLLPLASGMFMLLLNSIIVTSLSVYLLLDGSKTVIWLRTSTPLHWRKNINFFLDTLNDTMGGFVRGQIILATVISIIMGTGYAIIGVPYAMLLAVIIFLFEFVPQIGSYISISIAILLACSMQGWQTGLIVAVFSIIVQGGLDGQILAPRILGKAVGIHPIVSIGALLIGSCLFGLLGAFLAAPGAGIVQTMVIAYWRDWKLKHPEQFPDHEEETTVRPRLIVNSRS